MADEFCFGAEGWVRLAQTLVEIVRAVSDNGATIFSGVPFSVQKPVYLAQMFGSMRIQRASSQAKTNIIWMSCYFSPSICISFQLLKM